MFSVNLKFDENVLHLRHCAAPTCTSCRLSKLSLLLEAAGTETSASEVKTPRRRQPPVGPGAAAGKHVAFEAEKVSKLIVG